MIVPHRVLLADALSPSAVEVLCQRGITVDSCPGLDHQSLCEIIADYDAIAVRSATAVTADLIEQASRLKVIGRAGVGIDNVDVNAATVRGIVVMNTPLGNAITTAEHTIALLMALARRIPQANASTRAGIWEKKRFVGIEVTGKTIGLIGCGNVGSIVAQRALGLQMKVLVHDPYLSGERACELEVEKTELGDLLARADFISLHVPLNEHTRNILDEKALERCRKGVYVINCARGGLIVEEHLKRSIESGQVAGAAIDVFPTEPARENILFGLEQVICTPHLGASTVEAQEKVAIQIAKQIADFLNHGIITNALNSLGMSLEEGRRLKPYLQLARQLGSFVGQIADSGLCELRVEYEGHAAGLRSPLLTAAVLQGLLSPLLDRVNIVNAPLLARERGIAVSETQVQQERDYHTLIRVTVLTENSSHEVAGSLFGGNLLRIVEVDNMPVEAMLASHTLLVRNLDQPGFVGRLGTILGDAGINIGTLHLGRTAPGVRAISLVTVDQAIDDELLRVIRKLPGVVSVDVLHFND